MNHERTAPLSPFPYPAGMALIFAVCLLGAASAGIYVNAISPFWFDETFTGAVSCQPSLSDTVRLARHDLHPLLYHILVHFLFDAVGCHLWAVRLVSLAASLGGAALLLVRIEAIGGNRMAALAVIAGSPAFWYQAFEARSYGLLFLMSCGVFWGMLSTAPAERNGAVAFAFVAGLLHYFAAYLFAIVLLLECGFNRNEARSRRFLLPYIAAGGALVLYYAFQLPNILATGTSLTWARPPGPRDLLLELPKYFLGGAVPVVIIGLVVLTALAAHPLKSARNRTALLSFLGLPVFATVLFVISQVHPVFAPRYMYFTFPCLIVGLACLTAGPASWLGAPNILRSHAGHIVHAGLLAFLVWNTVHMARSIGNQRSFSWAEAARTMTCTDTHPCAFVVDALGEDITSDAQMAAVANYWATPPSHFTAVRRDRLDEWMKDHPGAQLLWTSYSDPSVDLDLIARRGGLSCRDFRVGTAGAIACTVPPSTPGGGL